MRFLLICCAFLVGCASAQYVKSGVKGGYVGQHREYQGGKNLIETFSNGTLHGSNMNLTNVFINRDIERGVCYQEIPTASLVRDPAHVPAGNGSRPDLSRIRTCCHGYIKNIYNYKICEPVCTKECVNALCTAPDTCTCFPDHVKNAAGICVATCPIGCQNGHCSGGECLCKEGFRLDLDGKFCLPLCRGNCGGIGNCTSPNTCECRPGYQSTPDGSCSPVGSGCDRCTNGDCVSNECKCHQGYLKDQQGLCVPQCPGGCGPGARCISPNICMFPNPTPPPSNYTTPALNQSFNHSYPYNQSPNQRPNQVPNHRSNQFFNPYNSDPYLPYYPQGYRPSYPQQGPNNSTYHNQYPGHNPNSSYPNQYPNYNPNSHNPNSEHSSYPNQGSSNYPFYPDQGYTRPSYSNQNSNSPHQGSQYPYLNNQGPRLGSNQSTSSNQDTTYIVNTPNQHGYPTSLSQVVNSLYSHNQSNYSSLTNHSSNSSYSSNQGLYPSYPSNHGSYPSYPSIQTSNPSYSTNHRYNPSYPSNQGQYPPYPPNQGTNSSYSPNQGSYPSYPSNQGSYPSYPSSQTSNPSYPSNQGQYPAYPPNQGTNSSYSPNQGSYPSYPSNQGSYPSYPSSQTSNPSYPSNQGQYPAYPPNQGTNSSYSPNQGSYPSYPSNQGSYPSYPSSQTSNPSYPSNQGQYPSYPPNQGSNPSYPSNQGYNPSYPSSQGSNPSYPSSPNYPNHNRVVNTTKTPENELMEPIYDNCAQPCINGECLNARCICSPGYELDRTDTTGHTCQRIKPTGCIMECISSDVCICKTGYHRPPGVKA